ncbi:AfsR/SARP family transcriptional regulator [Streptomyces sp. LP05-1]|uniref:AfsR/SARP family transcriptional regulator n=1 Tax=Streptomyces pyxinae TaxID=2970734 RepID=A0ABT2CLT7_9ACTN|nr:AfsR/SARP family transcriptional regulator [Streptomyces sp. LP05-1]MCS0638375.1 AfsR/SARP family transcriptional regulator [Streptomyces sp. LP05-1]
MKVDVLGPLEVSDDGVPVRIPGEKLRAIVAVLALSPGRPVSRNDLIDELWGEEPPRNAENSLHGHIARLRRVLATRSGKPDLREIIETSPSGYALTSTGIEVDAARFEELVRRADLLGDGALEEAAALLTEATGLWRGPALVDTGQGAICRMAYTRLQQTRITACEKLFDVRLKLNQHRSLISDLEQMHAMHPFHERFCAQLITALCRSGRQADALDAYSQMCERLSHSLGLDPGRELQSKFYGILRQDPALL